MKREVRREKKLPAFSLDIGELEALWTRLATLFENPEDVYASLEIALPFETLEFQSIEELKQCSGLPDSATKFSLRLRQGSRYLSLRSAFMSFPPEVSASGETESWCAGAIETAYSFVLSNKLWYSWVVTAPLGWVLLLCAYGPGLSLLLLPKVQQPPSGSFLVAWFGVNVPLAALLLFKNRLLPPAILIIKPTESFVRRHSAELSLAVAVLSLVLSIVGLFIAK